MPKNADKDGTSSSSVSLPEEPLCALQGMVTIQVFWRAHKTSPGKGQGYLTVSLLCSEKLGTCRTTQNQQVTGVAHESGVMEDQGISIEH